MWLKEISLVQEEACQGHEVDVVRRRRSTGESQRVSYHCKCGTVKLDISRIAC